MARKTKKNTPIAAAQTGPAYEDQLPERAIKLLLFARRLDRLHNEIHDLVTERIPLMKEEFEAFVGEFKDGPEGYDTVLMHNTGESIGAVGHHVADTGLGSFQEASDAIWEVARDVVRTNDFHAESLWSAAKDGKGADDGR